MEKKKKKNPKIPAKFRAHRYIFFSHVRTDIQSILVHGVDEIMTLKVAPELFVPLA